MKKENVVLMREARESLKGKWGVAVGALAIFVVITAAVQQVPKAGPLLGFIISGPMSLGFAIFYLTLSRGQNAKLNNLFDGFEQFGSTIGLAFFIALFTLLWTLLLIVPGIIAALSYSMAYFVMVDDPSVGPLDAINKSKAMMNGYKWKLFKLHLRFLGWAILCLFTLGIGFLWLTPYIQVSLAKFYDDLKSGTEPVVVV